MSGLVLPDGRTYAPSLPNCPSCGAKPERRVMSGSFGGRQVPICRDCGHEYCEEATTHAVQEEARGVGPLPRAG